MYGLKIKRKKAGLALVWSLVSLFLLLLLGTAILALTSNSLYLTKRVQDKVLAFNLAESGAERAIRWFKDQMAPPPGDSPFDPFGGAQTMGAGTYKVTVYPSPENSGVVLKKYTIVSEGNVSGVTQKVEIVLRQQSFGKYAYFTDKEVSSFTGSRIWFISQDRIRGPAHSNNADGSDFQIYWGADPGPIFWGLLTSVANDINYAPKDPATEAEFLQIYKTGSMGYQLGVDPILLPPSSDAQKIAAWGSSSGFPNVNGVYIPSGGGIYVCGDASVKLQLDVNGNQQFIIKQGTTTTTLTIDLLNDKITKQVGSNTWVYNDAGNGVFYCSGNITSLSGVVADNILSLDDPPEILAKSSYTIATDVNAGKNIVITGPLTYNSKPDPNLPIDDPVNLKPGTLGLIAKNVIIAKGTTPNMEIDGVILAGSSSTSDGSFYVADYNTKKPTGTLRVVGGIIQKARGPVGTFSGGKVVTGYVKDYWYDPRLADFPPPAFPTTGKYDMLSWRRLPN